MEPPIHIILFLGSIEKIIHILCIMSDIYIQLFSKYLDFKNHISQCQKSKQNFVFAIFT